MALQVGDQIPDVYVQATSAVSGSLKSLHQGPLILYFYPKDHTPGCTQEGKDFRDLYAEFQQENATIFGISKDTLSSHEKFKAKQEFPFELIADTQKELCELFGVLVKKSMFGKSYMGIERTTVLADANGTIQKIWPKVKVSGHARAVLDAVKALKK